MTEPNPIDTEIIRNALVAAAEEMNVTIWRTARSTVVRETLDYSTALFDAHGRNTAQSARIAIHLNSMAACLEDILAGPIPLDTWREGDVVVTNDPYSGGQHLPDILTFKPVFFGGRRIAVAGTLVHHTDVGGGAPGSYDAEAREVFQEGLRIPPCRILEAGRPNGALLATILANSREPEKVRGDLEAQLASLDIGAQGVLRLAERYGAARLEAATERILAQSEAMMRAAISEIPDGTYGFTDHVDDDGITSAPHRITAEVTIRGDRARIDLSGSGPQASGPINCTLNMTRSAAYCALMCAAGAEVPANSGAYRPFDILAPEGTICNARYPAPVANRMATGHRIVTTVLGALAQAVPDRIPAAYYGMSYVYALGLTGRSGRPEVYFDIEVGGWGAHPEADGASALSACLHNLANTPIEMCESLYPITMLEYSLAEGTGGAGMRRGGLGIRRRFRLDAERGTLSTNYERFRIPPYGLAGGAPGAPGRSVVTRNGEARELPSKVANLELARGDTVMLQTSGGGGWGPPGDRPGEDRERDRRLHYGYD